MASLAFSEDRTSMNGQVVLNFGFSKLHIILCFGTWLFCLGAVALVEADKSIAADFTILANMANLIQLSFWLAEAESIHKQPTLTSQQKIQEAASSLFTVASTSENFKMTISPSWYLQRSMFMGFVSLVPFLSIPYIKNLFIEFLMLLLVSRTSLALVRLWLSPDEIQSREFQILSRLTGLTLCEATIPNLLELVFKVDPFGIKDGEAESRQEKDLMLELDQKSEKEEVKADLLDDQDWEQVEYSSSIYVES